MKLEQLIEAKAKSGHKKTEVFHLELFDDKTKEHSELEIHAFFVYDDGDVGFGSGPGKSHPGLEGWTMDGIEAGNSISMQNLKIKKGDEIDFKKLKPFADPKDIAHLKKELQ